MAQRWQLRLLENPPTADFASHGVATRRSSVPRGGYFVGWHFQILSSGMVIARVIEIATAAGACAAIVYDLLCIWRARKFVRQRRAGNRTGAQDMATPPVSILKPLRGTDPHMYESFRSHCLLDYAQYEILFAVHEAGDPAVALVERLQAEFPQKNIRLLVFPKALGANIKVSNLAQMVPLAKHEYLVVNDSDIRVRRDYLARVMAPFADPLVGMVTCLYKGIAGGTIASKLEALGISTDFCAGVLMAHALEGELRFGLGSTLAFHKSDLAKVGGFEALVDYLADDYELGARIAASGKRVAIAETVVETFLPSYSWLEFVRHQLRWLRGIRNSRAGGYVGLAITYGVPWALMALALARGAAWACILLAMTLTARLSQAFATGVSVLGDQEVRRLGWLIPVRDCIALMLWVAGCAGRTVHWRGDRFLLRNGKLEQAVNSQKFV